MRVFFWACVLELETEWVQQGVLIYMVIFPPLAAVESSKNSNYFADMKERQEIVSHTDREEIWGERFVSFSMLNTSALPWDYWGNILPGDPLAWLHRRGKWQNKGVFLSWIRCCNVLLDLCENGTALLEGGSLKGVLLAFCLCVFFPEAFLRSLQV